MLSFRGHILKISPYIKKKNDELKLQDTLKAYI